MENFPLSEFDVRKVIKVWNVIEVATFLLNLKVPFVVEGYDKHGHTSLYIAEIHPHHLEGVDFRNRE